MKKVLSTLTIMACLAGVANAAPYVLPENQPGAYTGYDWTPVYSLDALCAFGVKKHTPDMWGARLGFNLYSMQNASVRHQFSLSAAYEGGHEKYTENYDGIKVHYKDTMTAVPITLGYHVHLAVCDEVAFFLGGRAGYSIGEITEKNDWYAKDKVRANGFTFGVGAGVQFQCSESVYIRVGYEFGRTYVDTKDTKGNYGQHTISLGVGCWF